MQGVKASQIRALQRTYRRRVAPERVVSSELARHLTKVSSELGRQVGVLLTRDGTVRNVVVGDASQLMIPEVGRLRGGPGRFRGLRLVHTHLKGEALTEDDLNDLALLRLDLVAMVEVLETGLPGRIEVAHILIGDDEQESFRRIQAPSLSELDFNFAENIQALERELAGVIDDLAAPKGTERALVVGVSPDDEHFEETLELVRSAGVSMVGSVRQRRRHLHPRTVVGRGKLQKIVLEGMRKQADVAIFDTDLRPAQARAFEDSTGMKAVDRTQLILDIFAQRARSRDGKLQVELAQLKYSLPRLTEKDEGLSRLTGGIGGRGPGETVLEIGRRRIRDRIRKLEKQVAKLSRQRDLRRQRRKSKRVPVLSIIGYTNAGKTTLLNALTDSSVAAADRLFVTLDPTSRRLRFPRQGEVIISDTVGFLRDLPPDLVAAFRATLEELGDADLLLHVADIADPHLDHKIEAVEAILQDLGLGNVPRLMILNKADLLEPADVEVVARRFDAITVSAVKRQGLEELLEAAEIRLGNRKGAKTRREGTAKTLRR